MDDWQYVERQVVCDPKGRSWSVALMDLLGQEGDPELPGAHASRQDDANRYFTLIYSANGGIQWERGHSSLAEATREYERLLAAVIDGSLDPAQPVFREDLED